MRAEYSVEFVQLVVYELLLLLPFLVLRAESFDDLLEGLNVDLPELHVHLLRDVLNGLRKLLVDQSLVAVVFLEQALDDALDVGFAQLDLLQGKKS